MIKIKFNKKYEYKNIIIKNMIKIKFNKKYEYKNIIIKNMMLYNI
jgi:ribosome-associated toxin RatA of RatAB toxin-antitoxin module